jgi:hypothetical protein
MTIARDRFDQCRDDAIGMPKDGSRLERASASSWVVPAALIVAVEYLFAFAIGVLVGFRYQIPFTTYMVLGLTFAGIGAVLIILVKLARYALQRERSPVRRLARDAPYIFSFVAAVVLCALQIAALTWTKIMLPIASPFWADPLLANMDHAIFQVDPWRIAHFAFGWAAPFIDQAYITWAPLKFGTVLLLALAPESPNKSRAFISYFLMFAAVSIGQYGLSSGGPVFYHQLGFGSRFDQLPIEAWVAEARNYLWHDYVHAGGDIGGGISAMPSLHVGAALWMALVWGSYDRRAGYVGIAYFSLIAIGSVLLGWHYGVDGLAASAIVIVAWKISPALASSSSHGRVPVPVAEEALTSITPT